MNFNLKSFVKTIITFCVNNNFLWGILNNTIIPIAHVAERERGMRGRLFDKEDFPIELISPDFTVKHGVFKGMRYPGSKSAGSAYIPKLLGSYEWELQSILKEICAKTYTEIIDVGCAEGYYAVGLAMRIPTAKVFAFDTNSEARDLCRQMAELNDVSERLNTDSFCNSNTLKTFPFTDKALIFCDCEGYEKELFDKENVSVLAKHDLLIEIHDFIDIEISSYIRALFEGSHKIVVVNSIDDIKKAQEYAYPELEAYNLATKKYLLGEHRQSSMEWFYLTPKNPLKSVAKL